MGRAPCCVKMGLKKGPWTPEEDLILINYINTYGHANWRALPKQAGLLLEVWKELQTPVDKLSKARLQTRWSAIAARLPGRIDNVIKNVWPSLLKKRLQQNQQSLPNRKRNSKKQETKLDSKSNQDAKQEQEEHVNFPIIHETKEENTGDTPQCSSDITTSDNNSSISVTTTNDDDNNNNNDMSINISNPDSLENNLVWDEDFWSEVLSSDNSDETAIGADYDQFQLPFERDLMASSSSMCAGRDDCTGRELFF